MKINKVLFNLFLFTGLICNVDKNNSQIKLSTEEIKLAQNQDQEIKEKSGELSGYHEQINKALELGGYETWLKYKSKIDKNFKKILQNILNTKLQAATKLFNYNLHERDESYTPQELKHIEDLLRLGSNLGINYNSIIERAMTYYKRDLVKLYFSIFNDDKDFQKLLEFHERTKETGANPELSYEILELFLKNNNLKESTKSQALFEFINYN